MKQQGVAPNWVNEIKGARGIYPEQCARENSSNLENLLIIKTRRD